ncbi:MAG: methyltransferase domain-containing protein [Actinomycetota bacterium]
MLFEHLEAIQARPAPFSHTTVADLWTDPHISERMLELHLDGDVAMASRTTSFIERSVRWLTELAASAPHPAARVLDLGCGPGLYANRLARVGAEVVGVDFSERSIRHAARTADASTNPTYVLGDYLDVEIAGSFDLVLLAMCDYCALGPTQRRRLLRRVRTWLRPDGRFVFDVYGLRSLRDRGEGTVYEPDLMDGFWSAAPYHGFRRTFVYPDDAVLLDRYDIIEANRSRTIFNWLQHFDVASITTELEAADLVVDGLYGDLTGADAIADPEEFCVVATPSRTGGDPTGLDAARSVRPPATVESTSG